MKVLKNPLIVTCTVDKELFEYVKVRYCGAKQYGRQLNNAEVMRKMFDYFLDMEEVDKELEREKEARMFRL